VYLSGITVTVRIYGLKLLEWARKAANGWRKVDPPQSYYKLIYQAG